jgi:alpha-1,6-mannosyltransferase
VSRTALTRLWAWSAVGLTGSLLAALAAPRALADGVVGWWYTPGFPGSRSLGVTLVWVGMGLLALAWTGVALDPGREALTTRRATLVALTWMLPLALAPPLFSRDVYSYLAQGTLVHLGHNPYIQAPAALAALHHGHTLAAVSPFWRHTTAPYGPLFLELTSLIVAVCGQHLIAGVLLSRVLDLTGLGLLVFHLPRLTRALGADAGRGIWLAAASPLTALGLIAAGHNDVLMAGLLAAGLSLALRGNPLLGVAVCALAGTIKVPALVGAVFIAVAWARAEPDPRARRRFLAAASAIVAGVLALVTLTCGLGLRWLSSGVFSTPARVHLAITPSTASGYTAAVLAHAVGLGVSTHGLESALGLVVTACAAAVGLGLLWRAQVPRVAALLGATLVLAAAGGPAAWPWYLSWGIVLLAACPGPQRSRVLLVPLVIGGLLVKPNGILVLPQGASPVVLALYLLFGVAAWVHWGRSRPDADDPAAGGGATPPAGRPGVGPALVRT